MEVKGKLVNILPVESGTSNAGKEWSKQSIIVDNGDKYNPQVCITFFGDNAKKLEGFTVGHDVTVSINLSSREFNGKWYHNVDGWKVEAQGTAPAAPTAPTADASAPAAPAPTPMETADDDLPF